MLYVTDSSVIEFLDSITFLFLIINYKLTELTKKLCLAIEGLSPFLLLKNE